MRAKLKPLLLFLLPVLLGACSPATMNDSTASAASSLRYVWVGIYNQAMPMWRTAADIVPILVFFAILLPVIVIAVAFSVENGKGAFVSIMFIGLMVTVYATYASWNSIVTSAPEKVRAAADAGSQQGVEAKKKEVSMRYAELLNYQFTALLPNSTTDFTKDSVAVKVCKGGYDTPSNCAPYEHVYNVDPYEVCTSHDDDGDCDGWTTYYHHQHDPDVTYLVRYSGVSNLPDIYATSLTGLTPDPDNKDHPLMYFSEWMLPEDYGNHWYSIMPWDHWKQYDSAAFTKPVDWLWYKTIADSGQLMGVSSDHQYSNPLLATANAGFVGDPAVLAKLEAAGMLLTPRNLYSPSNGPAKTYFDFVYPLGSLAAENVDWAGFSNNARTVNMYYGNVFHISNSFAYVNQSDLDQTGVTIDALVYNIKADLYNEKKWNRNFGGMVLYTIMQQNTVLTVCAVSKDPSGKRVIKSNACRVMSGLPIGNESLKEAFASGLPDELQNVELTPQSFFGNPSIIAAADGKLALQGTTGSPMGLWERFGAKKPSMEDNFSYLIDRIVLTPAEINQVINEAVAQQKSETDGLYALPGIALICEVLFLIVITLMVLSRQ